MISKVLAMACSVVAVPIALGYLGKEQYGLWATVTSLIGMLAFADLGVGNGLMNATAASNGRDDMEGVRRAIVSGMIAVLLTGAVLLLIFLVFWPFIDWRLVLAVPSSIEAKSAAIAVLALVILFAVNMPVSTVQKVQYGIQEGRWVSLSQSAAALIGLLFTYLVVRLDLGVVGMVCCFTLAAILADGLFGFLFFQRHRAIAPRLSDWSPSESRQLLRTGLLFLFLQVGVSICFASDNFIIAHVLGHEAVTEYSIHQKLFSPITFVAGLALMPLWSAFGDATARGDVRWIKKTLLITSTLLGVCGLICGGLIFAGADWLMLHWLKGRISANHTLCLVLMLWACVDLTGRSIAMFLNGAGLLKQQMLIVAIFVPVCITLKLLLARKMGLQGIVLGTMIAWLLVHVPAYSLLIRSWMISVAVRPRP
jgi:O-antigen/teichoic acid export membrane protein